MAIKRFYASQQLPVVAAVYEHLRSRKGSVLPQARPHSSSTTLLDATPPSRQRRLPLEKQLPAARHATPVYLTDANSADKHASGSRQRKSMHAAVFLATSASCKTKHRLL